MFAKILVDFGHHCMEKASNTKRVILSGNVQLENDCLELSKFVFDDKVDVMPECVDYNCARMAEF